MKDQQQQKSRGSSGVAEEAGVKVRRIPIPNAAPEGTPDTQPSVERVSPQKPRFGGALGAIAAGLMVAAGVFAWTQPAPVGDTPMTAMETQARLTAFQAHGPLKLRAITLTERVAAIQAMALPPAEQKSLEQDLDRGLTRLVQITLWDDRVEDGDVVELISTGFSRVVALTKAKQTITIPITTGVALQLRGVRDGGGGITVAADTASGPLAIPVMTPGQVVAVAVSP